MRLKHVTAVTAAFLLVVSASSGAVAATSGGVGTDALSGVAYSATSSTTNLTYNVTQDNPAGKTVKLKSYADGNNPAANWTITAPDGTEVVNVTETSTVSFTPEQAGNFTVSISANESNYDGETSELEIERQSAALTIKNQDKTPTHVGDTVEYKVGTSNNALSGVNVTLTNERTNESRTAVSGENGYVNVTYWTNGTMNLTLTKEPTATTKYEAYNRSTEITYESETLVVGNTNASADNIGDTIEFTITDGSSTPESDVNVTVGNETLTTDENGVVNVTFTENRTYMLEFTKNVTNGTVYEPVYYNTTVEPKVLTLDINVTEPVRPNETIAFDLDDTDSHSVANATIRVGNRTLVTNADGQNNTTFGYFEQGVYNVTATKETYETVERNLTVDAAGEELTFQANRTNSTPGETYRFNVTNNGTGVDNATVTVLNETYETTNGTVNVSIDQPGNHTVNATAPGHEYRTINVTVDEPLVNVTFDGAASTADNKTATANLTLADAPNGLTGYDVVVTISDNATARFNTSATTYSDAFDLTENAAVSENGTRLTLEAADLNGSVEAGAESVTLATLGIDGVRNGTVEVTVVPQRIDANEESIDARTDGANFTVVDAPNLLNDTQVRDSDNDGTYEDLNGNGETDYADVVTMFDERESDAVQDSSELFDFTGSGDVGFYDLVALYEETQSASSE